jgi:Predicted nucleic acid-binding protein, contains PIN domain
VSVVLPDTSIWVAFLRAGSSELTNELERLLDRNEVVVCGPVLAELIAGARAPDRPALLSTLGALPWADLGRREWQSVGLLAAELRGSGQVLPLTDVEIAVAAQAASAVLWTADRDFDRLRELVDGLQLRLEPSSEQPEGLP